MNLLQKVLQNMSKLGLTRDYGGIMHDITDTTIWNEILSQSYKLTILVRS